MTRYDHTQYGPLNVILYLLAGWFLFWYFMTDERIRWLMLALAGVMFFFSLCFQFLRIRDSGDHLSVRFGPLPIFGTKIRFAEIRSASIARSTLIDGWGVHYIPRRGWIYNIFGFDCVRIELDGKAVRVGTNEPQRLLRYVESRMGQNRGQNFGQNR